MPFGVCFIIRRLTKTASNVEEGCFSDVSARTTEVPLNSNLFVLKTQRQKLQKHFLCQMQKKNISKILIPAQFR